MSTKSTVFLALLRAVANASPAKWYNNKGVIQSSVGMIFDLGPAPPGKHWTYHEILEEKPSEISLLFTQRAGYEAD